MMNAAAKIPFNRAAVLAAAGTVALVLAGPLPPAAAEPVTYDCEDGLSFVARFSDSELVLELPGDVRATLAAEISASGMRYAGEGLEFHGKADEALFTRPGEPQTVCRAASTQAAQAEEGEAKPSFACEGPLAATERHICDEPGLARLDGRMAGLYEGLLARMDAGGRGELQRSQRGWLEERDGCGVDSACIEERYHGRIAWLEEHEAASAPAPVAAAVAATELPHSGRSLGGLVRSGPGMHFDRMASLRKGEKLTLLEDSGVTMNGYNWFRIEYRGESGYQWGGLICSSDAPVSGALQVCD